MTETAEPQPCDCCHAEDDTWTRLPLTVAALSDPALAGATMRLLTHALGQDGRLHLAVVAQGLFEGGTVDANGNVDQLALIPDPEAPGMSRMWKATAEEALQRRRDALDAGEQPGRELWGPLTDAAVLQVAR